MTYIMNAGNPATTRSSIRMNNSTGSNNHQGLEIVLDQLLSTWNNRSKYHDVKPRLYKYGHAVLRKSPIKRPYFCDFARIIASAMVLNARTVS